MTITVGTFGEQALRALYLLGVLTIEDFGLYAGLSYDASRRTLTGLRRSKLVDVDKIKANRWVPLVPEPRRGGLRAAGGRAKDLYHLSGAGVTYGGFLSGVETERRAKAGHKRCQVPDRANHAKLRNAYLFRVMSASERSLGLFRVPRESLAGESHVDFPLSGAQHAPDANRKNARVRHEWFVPDGRFVLRRPHERRECEYFVQVEFWTRTEEVAKKIEKYCGRWLRLLRSDHPHTGSPAPVVFLQPDAKQAWGMSKRLSSVAREGRLPRYEEFCRRFARGGCCFVFAGWDEVGGGDPYADLYLPLRDPWGRYPSGPLCLSDPMDAVGGR